MKSGNPDVEAEKNANQHVSVEERAPARVVFLSAKCSGIMQRIGDVAFDGRTLLAANLYPVAR